MHAEQIFLRGVIIPMEWGQSGEVLSVGLAAEDEHTYLIEPQDRAGALKLLLQKKVMLQGEMSHRHGKRAIVVKEYKEILPPEGTLPRVA
jgi:hypothetical protein